MPDVPGAVGTALHLRPRHRGANELQQMKIKSAEYEASSASVAQCPQDDLAEFAAIGRSNVGKSSLLNFLMERRDLVKVSKTPGCTRTINLFRVNDAWRLVDLPGYGYAARQRSERSKFGGMIMEYIRERQNLCSMLVLIDSSLPPQKIDMEFIHWLTGEGVPFVVIFTKADKSGPVRLQENIKAFESAVLEFCENLPMMFVTSVARKQGREEVMTLIVKAMAAANKL